MIILKEERSRDWRVYVPEGIINVPIRVIISINWDYSVTFDIGMLYRNKKSRLNGLLHLDTSPQSIRVAMQVADMTSDHFRTFE